MTIRGYIALFYAVLATGASVFAGDIQGLDCSEAKGVGKAMMAVQVDWTRAEIPGEFEPVDAGAWERDDLPAYLTEGPADWSRGEDVAEGMAGDAAL